MLVIVPGLLVFNVYLFSFCSIHDTSTTSQIDSPVFFYPLLHPPPTIGLVIEASVFDVGFCDIIMKEREMEIGYPTDVKHAAHIGWDGSSSSAPSWMNEFKTTPNFAATAIGNSASGLSAWSSQGILMVFIGN
uniref:CRIB domain-containing protein n=1 Tax=Lactuca sativa TaxID=4236 RepID=A0A9R1W194_LACSA|nr:hypothetical protein LSAT_V11C300128670 [Lactuca sativa]